MTSEDLGEFVALLAETAEVLGGKLPSKMALGVYYRMLKDFEMAEVRRAISNHVRTSRFFPRPCELVERIAGTVEDRARRAWQEVLETLDHHGTYASVRFSSPLIHWTLVRMGGWPRLGGMSFLDEPFCEKDFVSWYGKAETMGVTWADVPGRMPGRIELNNRMQGIDPARLGLRDAYIGEVVEIGSVQSGGTIGHSGNR